MLVVSVEWLKSNEGRGTEDDEVEKEWRKGRDDLESRRKRKGAACVVDNQIGQGKHTKDKGNRGNRGKSRKP